MKKETRHLIRTLRTPLFVGLLVAIAVLLAACTPPIKPEPPRSVPIGQPCSPSEDGISCGGDQCEPAGDGRFFCPGNRICERQEGADGGIVCQEGSDDHGTVTRPPVKANDDEPFTATSEDGNCQVGILLKMGLRNRGGKRITLTQNLAHGFDEVVVPSGQEAVVVTFEPVPDATGPYDGTFTGTWEVQDPTAAQPFRQSASARNDASNIVKNFIKARKNWQDIPGAAGRIQEHTVTGTWEPDSGGSCSVSHTFKVVYAGDAPTIPPLRLNDFVAGHQQTGYGGPTTTTRPFVDQPPEPRSRPGEVMVPFGIYWEVGNDCCGIRNARAKVIQFARAAIDGPNGRYAKDWTLDIREDEVDDAPDHDPTYTNKPGSDSNENPSNSSGAGGGTARSGDGLVQWDAPGMPRSLYDRLFHAEDASTYRQQLLSFLVCRASPSGTAKHRASFYLNNALVKQIALTTVTWEFPGQHGVDRSKPAQLRQPRISVSFETIDAGCRPLSAALSANGLTNEFSNPDPTKRPLEILSQPEYDRIKDGIEGWANDPAGSIH